MDRRNAGQPGGGTDRATDVVQSIVRGLAVIRAFGAGREELTISEVARSAKLTRAGARRILLTLRHLEYVDTDGRRFYLTPKILELGYAYMSSKPLWGVAEPVLQGLADELNETASAGVLDGTNVVYVLRAYSRRVLHLGVSVGTRLPAHASSMGRLLLAFLCPAELDAYFRKASLRKFTKYTVNNPIVLRARIDEIRQQGWAYVTGEIEEGVCGVSVPIRGRNDRVIAALNVSTNSERTSLKDVQQDFVPRMRKAAARIEQALPDLR
ncbi:MAG: helix-turn-helix domain-containing protein [Proteobacteria bacterium]|nr:helix-turn-helix domain-containing protein [Pseudomonadota bacterium]